MVQVLGLLEVIGRMGTSEMQGMFVIGGVRRFEPGGTGGVLLMNCAAEGTDRSCWSGRTCRHRARGQHWGFWAGS